MKQRKKKLDLTSDINLDDATININDVSNSNREVIENTSLRIACHIDGKPAPTIRLSRNHAVSELLERQGTWLNYTINTTQCTDIDTYKCSGTSAGFNNTETAFNFNVLCNTRFGYAQSFKSIYGSKSGIDTFVNMAVPIITNYTPQTRETVLYQCQ